MLTIYLLTEFPFSDIHLLHIGNILKHSVLKYFHRKVLCYSIHLVLFLQILKSKRRGQDWSYVYIPTAYWYPLLLFLETETNADKSKSELDSLVSETPDEDVQETVNIF